MSVSQEPPLPPSLDDDVAVNSPTAALPTVELGQLSPAKSRLSPLATEIIVVIAFAYIPTLLVSVVYAYLGTDVYQSGAITPVRNLVYLVTMAQMTIPLLYIFRLNKGTWSELGLRVPRWSDLSWAILVFIAALIVYYGAFSLLYKVAPAAQEFIRQKTIAIPRTGAKTPTDYLALAFAASAVGFGEELLFRGYLISRWQRLSGSLPQAILISVAFFAIGHIYQGLLGVIGSAFLGLIYALFFAKFRRLWPIAIAHALTDFILLARM